MWPKRNDGTPAYDRILELLNSGLSETQVLDAMDADVSESKLTLEEFQIAQAEIWNSPRSYERQLRLIERLAQHAELDFAVEPDEIYEESLGRGSTPPQPTPPPAELTVAFFVPAGYRSQCAAAVLAVNPVPLDLTVVRDVGAANLVIADSRFVDNPVLRNRRNQRRVVVLDRFPYENTDALQRVMEACLIDITFLPTIRGKL